MFESLYGGKDNRRKGLRFTIWLVLKRIVGFGRDKVERDGGESERRERRREKEVS